MLTIMKNIQNETNANMLDNKSDAEQNQQQQMCSGTCNMCSGEDAIRKLVDDVLGRILAVAVDSPRWQSSRERPSQ